MLFMPSSYIVIALFFLTIAGLVRYQSNPERVFGLLMLLLYCGNFVTTDQVIGSFSNQGVLTLVLLMLCSLSLEKTRLLNVVARYVIKQSYRATWLHLFFLTIFSSAFLNNTAVVSTMLAPIRNNPNHSASKMLLPLSYAAILGGTLTLVGTSTNLIVNSLVIDKGMPSLGFFEFTKIGFGLVLFCGIALYFVSKKLPERDCKISTPSEYFFDTEVLPQSNLIGRSIEQNGLRNLDSLFLVEIYREGHLITPVAPNEIIYENDRLVFSGDIKKVTLLEHFGGLSSFANQNGLPMDNLEEVVIRPESVLVGKTLKNTGFRALFDAAVVAIKRDGEAVSGKLGEVTLCPGDYLVLAVGDDFKARHNLNKNFFLISEVETEGRLKGRKEILAIGGFLTAIFFSSIGLIPLFQGMFILLGGLLFSGALTVNELLQRLPWQIWLVISSALLLSQALTNTDAFSFIGAAVLNYQQSYSPLLGLVIIYLITWLLTELITNNAAAALMFPIAFSLAQTLEIEPISYIMTVAFAASASFMSPYGYQTNIMVFNAGQYRLSDFIKAGLPISIVYAVVTICTIAAIYQIV